ncbi:Chondroitin sulfate proteoglycan 4 [Bagarius yarrelli]|uniref:ADP-ribosylation factor-like protein 15 n=1 Tax=Bagarius yarrelli TaxID=175774 RepID=A0A556U827_BAGYA|nr:Chondroitin sulfate proteoglycan 4 [Bagarius yarrelli]
MKTLLSYGLLVLFVGVARGASFYGDGFVQLKVKDSPPSTFNTLHIRFRTSSQRGVLFLAAGQTHYLLLELSSGRLQAIIANATDLRKHSTPRTVHVQVTPVNDQPPVITANKVLRSTDSPCIAVHLNQVWVGSVTEITPEDLNSEDEDTAPEQLHYLTTQPSNGHLALKSAPTKPVMNFTQAHIDQGQLLFVHSGATAGGFNIQVNDGVNFAPRQIFSVTAHTLVLQMERSGPLKVYPGTSSLISKEVLNAATNDHEGSSNRTIVFSIVNPPKFGKLVTAQTDKSITEIHSFTQQMVDEGKVAYEQNVDSVGWAALDKFTFTVSSPPASLEDQTFDIDISYENAGPERNSLLLKNTGAVVTEGDKVIIDETMLDASNLLTKQPESRRNSYDVWYLVKSLPLHGVIIVGERNLTKEKPYFSQFILNKYGITYQHDNSETVQDRFVFDAFLNLKSKPAQRPEDDREVLEETFNVTVTPVNDQPPVLKIKAPSLKVVQGDTVALGPSNLNVEDLDNSPDEILYSVISRPTNGFLSLAGCLNVSVDTFSQALINNGEVFFVQDGSPASGVFYFSVTDGYHRPVYKLFNLEVLKIAISITNQTDLVLEQGQTSVVVNQSHLAAVTNGKNTTVQYIITVPPKYGRLLLDNEEVTIFNDDDLQGRRLRYQMISLVTSYDNFEFTAFTSEANLTDQMVNITVKPLIRYAEGVKFLNGIPVKLKADHLNVSELALVSATDPLFEILSPPRYGKILKTGNEKKGQPIKTFLFSELQQGKLVIELMANLTEVQEVHDSLGFVLKAGNLQPANGKFVFSIVPYDPALITMTTATSLYTSSTASPSQTIFINSSIISKSPSVQPSVLVTKAVPKFKGRNRWGSSNRSDSHATTIVKPTHIQEIVPVRNEPVRVESVPENSSTSNTMLIILPLIALLLVVIVIILALLLKRKQKKNKVRLVGSPESSPDQKQFQGHPERTAMVPLVTVTHLSPSNPGSPALIRLQTGNPAYGKSMTLGSFGDMDLEATQFCRTTNPTLQHNQYWCFRRLCCKGSPSPRPEYDVVCIGLSGAGKTSLISRLCSEGLDEIVPTAGFSIKAVAFPNAVLNVKELGGADNIKKYWSRYYQGSQGVVFVLDSTVSDEEMDACRSELHLALQHPQLCTLPFLILANHQDSPAARSVSEVR